MGALLRSQALGKAGGAGASSGAGSGSGSGSSAGPGFGAKSNIPGPASGPLSLAARRAGRPSLGSMGMPPSAPGGLQRPGAPSMGGLAGRRGPPGGLNLSSMTGGDKGGSKFSDFSNIMCVMSSTAPMYEEGCGRRRWRFLPWWEDVLRRQGIRKERRQGADAKASPREAKEGSGCCSGTYEGGIRVAPVFRQTTAAALTLRRCEVTPY